jgi:arginase
MKNLSLIGFPFYSLSAYRGMGMAVKALRRLGIAEVLSEQTQTFTDLGDTALLQITADSGPTNLKNFPQFLHATETVFRASSQVTSDTFVFCLGGECTFITGSLAGFKTKFEGKPGILWIDAHGDFNTPETTASGFIGGMCLAFLCGRGPKLNAAIENSRPLLSEENVVHLGSRSLDPLESKAMKSCPLKLYSASQAHEMGMPNVAREAGQYLAERSDWIICHLDVDSIDPSVISAVNFNEQGPGLNIEEVRTAVREVYQTGKLKVFDLAGYNPLLDPGHESGSKLVKLTSDLLSSDMSD